LIKCETTHLKILLKFQSGTLMNEFLVICTKGSYRGDNILCSGYILFWFSRSNKCAVVCSTTKLLNNSDAYENSTSLFHCTAATMYYVSYILIYYNIRFNTISIQCLPLGSSTDVLFTIPHHSPPLISFYQPSRFCFSFLGLSFAGDDLLTVRIRNIR